VHSRKGLAQTAALVVVATLLAGARGVGAPAVPTMNAPPSAAAGPGDRLRVSATAYCLRGKTKSGINVRQGIVAADPKILPVGSIISIEWPPGPLEGVYSVLDTGPAITGREVDIYMRDCSRAERFGRQLLQIRILRLGWSPQASAD